MSTTTSNVPILDSWEHFDANAILTPDENLGENEINEVSPKKSPPVVEGVKKDSKTKTNEPTKREESEQLEALLNITEEPKAVTILKRDKGQVHQQSPSDQEKQPEKSLAQREKEYQQAKERIFKEEQAKKKEPKNVSKSVSKSVVIKKSGSPSTKKAPPKKKGSKKGSDKAK